MARGPGKPGGMKAPKGLAGGPGSGGQDSPGVGGVSAQSLRGPGKGAPVAKAAALTVTRAITGAANNGSGAIRITATGHGFETGNSIYISGVGGTVEANKTQAWIINRQSANTFDLIGSTFTNAYTSGGSAGRR